MTVDISKLEARIANPRFNGVGAAPRPEVAQQVYNLLQSQEDRKDFFAALWERPVTAADEAQMNRVESKLREWAGVPALPPPATAKPVQARQEKPANTQARARGQMPTVEEARYGAHILRAFLVANGYEDVCTSIEVALRSTPVNITSR